jgi:hypothetical protein
LVVSQSSAFADVKMKPHNGITVIPLWTEDFKGQPLFERY